MPARTSRGRSRGSNSSANVADTLTDAAALRRDLLAWYRANKRELPWRSDSPVPYFVLVSEAMLQQTQVATVVPYFKRFIERFPTIAALAGADEGDVLRLWQGLGYYRRAKNLHASAKAIVERHGGKMPRDVDALLELPGIGRYTAGAIASIAFGVPAPILDGNVARVLARWAAIRESVDEPAVRDRLWSLAESLVSGGISGGTSGGESPGDFNQALMELGALVCVPRNPACLTCPVARHCGANALGLADELPVRSKRKAPRTVEHHVLSVRRGDAWLFQQRPATGLWASMWQLPTLESGEQTSASLIIKAKETLGLVIDPPRESESFRHQTTHRTITFRVWVTRAIGGRLRHGAGQWRGLDDVDDLALPNPQRKAIESLKRNGPRA